jgi:hypothetical protein
MEESMKCFGGKRQEVLFEKVQLKRLKTKTVERTATMFFRLKLTPANVKSAPKFIQEAYASIKNVAASIEKTSLLSEVEEQDVDIFFLPENPEATLRISAVDIAKISLERGENADIFMLFRVVVPMDKVIGEFCVQEFGTDKWLEFSETQSELFEDQEQQAELPAHKKSRGKTAIH